MSTSEEKKIATGKLAEIKKQIDKLVNEAQSVSDASGVEFKLDIAYGMGGTYYPKPPTQTKPEGADDDWEASWQSSDEYGWVSSSSTC